jgi:hypothetical protein
MKKLKRIFCAIFRHSNIESIYFGFHYCGRCGEMVGDSLGGVYKNPKGVFLRCKDMRITGHCRTCETNWQNAGFLDKFLTPKPEWLITPEYLVGVTPNSEPKK